MTRRWGTASTAGLLGALLLAACSDNGGLTADQKQSISDFRAGADVVCARVNQAVVDTRALYATQYQGRAPTVDEARDFLVRQVLPLVDRKDGDLHNLGEPTLNRSDWDDIMKEVDDRLSALKYAADTDPVKALQDFNRPATAKDSLQRDFEAFGAPECAKNP
jgi:hypothetical protein